MRILIVEDEEVSLDVLRFSLEGAGHEVDVASTGQQALAALGAGGHRLVISDWDMPGMSGVDLCRAVRARDYGGYVYFVLLTARDGRAATVEGLTAGADDFITKPFDPEELAARVRIAERILSLEMRDVTIFALAKLAESRDPETGQHLERVQNYSRLLAHHLWHAGRHPGITDAGFVSLIYQTSPLHDIGKVAIPDCVLLKPGRLSDREFQMMREHTTIGAQTLDAALRQFPGVRFLEMARDIAATHHERWDGTGYPNRLQGTNIPLCGRIVALADVYDALTSKRVYKGAFTHDVARSIILGDAGTHFDPDLVEAFVQIEPQFIAVREQYDETVAAAA